MIKLLYLGLILVTVVTVVAASTNKYPQSEVYYIALKHNTAGVDLLQNLILSGLSNISSPWYGHYLSEKDINNLLVPDIHIYSKLHRDLLRLDVKILRQQADVLMIHHPNLPAWQLLYKHADVIDFILPLKLNDNLPNIKLKPKLSTQIMPPFQSTKLNNNGVNLVARETLQRIYHLNNTAVNPDFVSIGVVEFMNTDTNGFNQTWLYQSQFANGMSLQQMSHIHGGNDYISDGESCLDVQVDCWASTGADMWYWNTPSWQYGWAVDFFAAETKPDVVSISWGWNEDDQCRIVNCSLGLTSQKYVARTNIEFMKIVATGRTLIASSGDAGSPGRTDELCNVNNPIRPIFPGGSPWVLSVGATYVTGKSNITNWQTPICKAGYCTTGVDEAVTSFKNTSWTSGAGFTQWDETPLWQYNEVAAYLKSGVALPKSNWNRFGRSYPDLVTFGHNCYTYMYGMILGTDGTSCSAPIMAGIITQLNNFQVEHNRPKLGYVNPLLYKLYQYDKHTFNDIIKGNSTCTERKCCGPNAGFLAFEGWDTVSGLGSPNIKRIKLALDHVFMQ